MTTSIFLVDDDPIILDAFSVYFSTADDLDVVGTAMTGRQALQWLESNACDIVLSDTRMPDINGIELLQKIQQLQRPPLFVAMTAFDTDETMLECLNLGAVGYITKSQEQGKIISFLREAANGGVILSPACTKRFISLTIGNSKEPKRVLPAGLTRKETRICYHIFSGKSNMEIAKTMHYSESSIKQNVSTILRKTNTKTRAELVAKYLPPTTA